MHVHSMSSSGIGERYSSLVHVEQQVELQMRTGLPVPPSDRLDVCVQPRLLVELLLED